MDRAYLRIALLAQVIAGRFDVFRRAAKRHEDRVGVFCFILGDELVTAPGQLAKFFVNLFEELENRLVEIVAAGDHAVHVVFLVLDGAEQDRIL